MPRNGTKMSTLDHNNTAMKRMWVNQPSTLQPYHKFDRMRVLVPENTVPGAVRVYFTEGPIISTMMNPMALSGGWPSQG